VQKIVGNARVSLECVCKKCITELIITQKSSCCLFTCKTAFDFIHTVQVDSGHIILQCYKLHSLPYILLSVFVRCWLGGSKGFWRISNLFIVIASLGHGLHYPGNLSVPSVAWRNECQLSDSVMTDVDVDGSSLPLPLQLPCEIWMAMQPVERRRHANWQTHGPSTCILTWGLVTFPQWTRMRSGTQMWNRHCTNFGTQKVSRHLQYSDTTSQQWNVQFYSLAHQMCIKFFPHNWGGKNNHIFGTSQTTHNPNVLSCLIHT